MKAKIFVLPLWTKLEPYFDLNEKTVVISTVSRAKDRWMKGLSPFYLGPVYCYGKYIAKNVENAWQYSKVYPEFVKRDDLFKFRPRIINEYWKWRNEGWANPVAQRYPMGKGRKPLFSFWNGKRLDYIQARKTIYAPLYKNAVMGTEVWERLVEQYKWCDRLILLDFDAYDHRKVDMTLSDVLNNPHKKMGHAFVLAMCLSKDKALKECSGNFWQGM